MTQPTEYQARLLTERYGAGYEPEGILWNAQIEHMLAHRSGRHYLPDALPDGAIETIVAAAQSASSSSNLHHWSVIVVDDPALKRQLSQISHFASSGQGNPYIEVAPIFLLWVADQSRNNALAKAHGGSGAVHEHLDALVMSTVDTALAAQNAALAAESLGLGICYIGAMRNKAQEVADLLGLPNHAYVTFGMTVGRPGPEPRSRLRPRPRMEVVLHRNGYQQDRGAGLADYEAPFKHFREEVGMREKTFVEAVSFASNDTAYMDGRENLRAMVQARGFKLK